MNEFDYVIVGAGSAGCVLANRLSTNPGVSVCLLEAGPEDRSPLIGIPGAFAYFMFSRKYNWRYNSTTRPDIRNGQAGVLPPRQDPGRLQRGQRHDLHPRPRLRL